MKAFVSYLSKRYENELQKLLARDTLSLRNELLAIHGIGEETADTILLYAAAKASFVVDAYTRRIVGPVGPGSWRVYLPGAPASFP